MLGLAPNAPVRFVPHLDVTLLPPASTEVPAIGEDHPRLAQLRAEYRVAEETLRLEVARQYPDLTLGPLLKSDEGRSKIGFLAGIPIPLWDGNRQRIAEARVERELARAAVETEYEALSGRWASARAWADALGEQHEDLVEVLVPLVERQVADALELMRLGEGSSQVLDSLTRSHEIRLELIEARTAEALARAELEYLAGPTRATAAVRAPEESR